MDLLVYLSNLLSAGSYYNGDIFVIVCGTQARAPAMAPSYPFGPIPLSRFVHSIFRAFHKAHIHSPNLLPVAKYGVHEQFSCSPDVGRPNPISMQTSRYKFGGLLSSSLRLCGSHHRP